MMAKGWLKVKESGFTVVRGKVDREAAVNIDVYAFREAASSIGRSGAKVNESFVVW